MPTDPDQIPDESPHGIWKLGGDRPFEIVCFRCGGTPAETHGSFVGPEQTAEEYVIAEEGTFNAATGHYACDACYIAIGMPTSPRGWVAP